MTAGMYSVASFIVKLKTISSEMNALGPAIVARACELVCAEAKRVLGTEGYDWPALSPATLAHKMQSGMLLETGELRGSIEWNSEGNQGWVGSNNDKAVWHEFARHGFHRGRFWHSRCRLYRQVNQDRKREIERDSSHPPAASRLARGKGNADGISCHHLSYSGVRCSNYCACLHVELSAAC